MKKGDIVSVIFPFTDLSSFKQRPALALHVEHEGVILAFITSRLSFQHKYDILIKRSAVNNPEADSIIILRKLFTGNKSLIKGKISELDKGYYPEVNKLMKELSLV